MTTTDKKPKIAKSSWLSPLLVKRFKKFRRLKRGWWSLLIITVFYLISLVAELLINNQALIVKYDGQFYFPIVNQQRGEAFGMEGLMAKTAVNYRQLKQRWIEEESENYVIMPLIPFSPNESLLRELDDPPPAPPVWPHLCGTDNRGRDVFVRLVYGFRISVTFAIIVTLVSYLIGTSVGAVFGYFGGRIDILGLRLVEIWSTVPFLYTMIILSSLIQPNFFLLIFILCLFGWIGIVYYVRGEFLREKSRDYVQAAISIGVTDKSIIFQHILPNSLTPLISFAPFSIVGTIGSLVSLDFLGFGLPAPTPSWGELLSQAMDDIYSWHLSVFPLGALFITLLLVTFIGEAVREAFDPKEHSRLR